jgi:hypothetical protein
LLAPAFLSERQDAYHNNPSLGGHFASATLVDQKKVRVYIHRKLDSLALASIELANEVKFGIVKKVPDFQPDRFLRSASRVSRQEPRDAAVPLLLLRFSI